jgi:GntR family transcriptional regulator
VRLQRLYRAGGAPLGLISSWLTPGAEALSAGQAEEFTVFGLLGLLGRDVVRAELAVGGRSAGRRLGCLLACAVAVPVLVLERTSFGVDGTPLEWSEFFVRADRYRFTMAVEGPISLSSSIRLKRPP